MSVPPEALQILGRMRDAGQEYGDRLGGSLPRATHDLAILAENYAQYLRRTGLTDARLAALGRQLQSASVALHRTRFDLEQQLYDTTYTLHQLQDVILATGTEASSLPEAVSVALEAYRTETRRGQQQIGTALRSLTLHLRLLAGNIEIAASHAEDTATTQIELFCTLANLLRSLADQLHGTDAELRIFEQTQLGHSESLRSLLTRQSMEVGG